MKRQALLSILASAAGLAVAYRRVSTRSERGARALGPGSLASATSVSATSAAGGVAGTLGRIVDGKSGDRGTGAKVPTDIPPRGWFDVLKRTLVKFGANELMAEGAGVTFFALLSIFPGLTAIISIYGLFADPTAIQGHLDSLQGFVPGGGLDILNEQVKRLTASPVGGLSLGAGLGILAALWSANQGSKAMLSALNRVHETKEGRGFFRLTAVAFAFTLGGMLALAAAIGFGFVLPALFAAFGLAGLADAVIRIARWPVVLLGLMAALATLYRFGPSEHRVHWRWVTPGGVIGAVAWVGLSYGFSWYVSHFGSYNKTYGSLGAVIGFMTWIWLSSIVLLVGAQINAELERQTEPDAGTA